MEAYKLLECGWVIIWVSELDLMIKLESVAADNNQTKLN